MLPNCKVKTYTHPYAVVNKLPKNSPKKEGNSPIFIMLINFSDFAKLSFFDFDCICFNFELLLVTKII